MTTSRDLLIAAMDMPSSRPLERGDLSLALAGAEAIDLLGLGAATLGDDGRLLPTGRASTSDPLLDEAVAALLPGPDGESVEDWLWRRGRGLSDTYLAALEADGQLTRERRRRFGVLRSSQMVLVDSAGRRRAAHRWAADDPTFLTLARTIGIDGKPAPEDPVPDGPTEVVLTSVAQAVEELAAERLRRAHRREESNRTYRSRGF